MCFLFMFQGILSNFQLSNEHNLTQKEARHSVVALLKAKKMRDRDRDMIANMCIKADDDSEQAVDVVRRYILFA